MLVMKNLQYSVSEKTMVKLEIPIPQGTCTYVTGIKKEGRSMKIEL